MTYHYDGRRFRAVKLDGEPAPVAHYRQAGDLIWAEFTGGDVRQGHLTGRCAPDGTLEIGYAMVLASGDVVAGFCVSIPEALPDGRIRLHERFRRFTPALLEGNSIIEEISAE